MTKLDLFQYAKHYNIRTYLKKVININIKKKKLSP